MKRVFLVIATLAAGAVVSRDLPANVTAVGVPAKVIKERPSGWYRDDHA